MTDPLWPYSCLPCWSMCPMTLPDCAYKHRVAIRLHDTGFRLVEVFIFRYCRFTAGIERPQLSCGLNLGTGLRR